VRRLNQAGLAIVAVALAIVAAGCGGSGSDESSDAGAPTTLKGSISAFPDYLDPALSLSLEGWSAMWNTYVPLLTYQHAAGAAGSKLIPGLAQALPKVSDDGRTFTLHLRNGLKYSDGTPIRASDFGRSLERMFKLNSGGSGYFTEIVGAEKFEKTKKGGISGITSDDATGRITIRLRQPSGIFPYELATLWAAPLPPDTPDQDQTAHPPPASGPYEIVAATPGRSWEYRRNPEWAKANAKLMPQLPGGHVDRIQIQVDRNPETQVNDVEHGDDDWMINPPPPDRIGALRQEFLGTQLKVSPEINVFYFWMNTRKAPFDDVRVRRAVNYAIDPRVLTRIYAGTMRPLQQVLPDAMPGHRTYHPYPHDMAKARALLAAADPADRTVTVWTNSYPPNREAGEYYEGVLSELGFQTKLKVIDPSNYFTVTGNLSTPELDTGWGNWLLDYPHPNDYFETQLTYRGIADTNNTNWAQFDDPALDAEVERLRQRPLDAATEARYARLDRAYMKQAPWAPWGTLTFTTFVSSEVELDKLIVSPVFGQDLTSFALR
jgi:peptide/nickel transport system substrate-binding protein